MKKTIYIYLLITVMFTLVSCGVKNEDNSAKTDNIKNTDKIVSAEIKNNENEEYWEDKIEPEGKTEPEDKTELEGNKESKGSKDSENNKMTYNDLMNIDIEFESPDYLPFLEIHELFESSKKDGTLYSAISAKMISKKYYITENYWPAWIYEVEITDTSKNYNYNNFKKGDRIKVFSGLYGFGLILYDTEDIKKIMESGTEKIIIDGEELYELDLDKQYEYRYTCPDYVLDSIICEENREYAFLLRPFEGIHEKVKEGYYTATSIYPMEQKNLDEIMKKFVVNDKTIYDYYGPQLVEMIKKE